MLFADLVGFTSMSEARDPEHVKNLVDACFQRLAADVTAFGGKVDKIIGDAIVALFGAPLAHEDDAERAVRAALRMQETIAAHAAEAGAQVQLRIGVNTGEVLVGALRAGGDYTAMGDVVNIASRLQSLTRELKTPLVVADAILRQIGGGRPPDVAQLGVKLQDQGERELRGRSAPVRIWTGPMS